MPLECGGLTTFAHNINTSWRNGLCQSNVYNRGGKVYRPRGATDAGFKRAKATSYSKAYLSECTSLSALQLNVQGPAVWRSLMKYDRVRLMEYKKDLCTSVDFDFRALLTDKRSQEKSSIFTYFVVKT